MKRASNDVSVFFAKPRSNFYARVFPTQTGVTKAH